MATMHEARTPVTGRNPASPDGMDGVATARPPSCSHCCRQEGALREKHTGSSQQTMDHTDRLPSGKSLNQPTLSAFVLTRSFPYKCKWQGDLHSSGFLFPSVFLKPWEAITSSR